jgi:hypothetical protein
LQRWVHPKSGRGPTANGPRPCHWGVRGPATEGSPWSPTLSGLTRAATRLLPCPPSSAFTCRPLTHGSEPGDRRPLKTTCFATGLRPCTPALRQLWTGQPRPSLLASSDARRRPRAPPCPPGIQYDSNTWRQANRWDLARVRVRIRIRIRPPPPAPPSHPHDGMAGPPFQHRGRPLRTGHAGCLHRGAGGQHAHPPRHSGCQEGAAGACAGGLRAGWQNVNSSASW